MHAAAMRAAAARGVASSVPVPPAVGAFVGQDEADAIAAVLADAPRGRVGLSGASILRACDGQAAPPPCSADEGVTPDSVDVVSPPPGPAAVDSDADPSLSGTSPDCSDSDGEPEPSETARAAGEALEAAAAAMPADVGDAPVLSGEEDDALLAVAVPCAVRPVRAWREPAWLAPYRARKARKLADEARDVQLRASWQTSQEAFGRLAAARPSWDRG